MKPHPRLTLTKRIPLAFVGLCFLAATGLAADARDYSAQDLIDTLEVVAAIARNAVPLAKQEFAVLEQKYQGKPYNTLIDRMRLPIAISEGSYEERNWEENLAHLRGHLEANDRLAETEEILVTIDQLRGLDGVLLAEAAAGASQEKRLLDLYVHMEAALGQLTLVHQYWR